MRILMIGGEHPTAVGQSLLVALQAKKEHQVCYVSSDLPAGHSKWLRRLFWHCFDRYPLNFRQLNRIVLERSEDFCPDLLICAGNIPLSVGTLKVLRSKQVRCGIWLTDDPWSKQHRSSRFLEALDHYDLRFSPRRSAMENLESYNRGRNVYLPFGYDERYFNWPGCKPELRTSPCSETGVVFFAGGADLERAEIMRCLLDGGLKLDLYGDYWYRYPGLEGCVRGYAPADKIGHFARSAAVSICLVRRSNRDGQSMRTYELAASGACMLVEKTEEHLELFGNDGNCVRYFSTNEELVNVAKELMKNAAMRSRLRENVSTVVNSGGHTYSNRLDRILDEVEVR